jgi:hypothetical protein
VSGTTGAPVRSLQVIVGMTQPAWGPDEYEIPAAVTATREIAATGVNFVMFTPTWYQSSTRGDVPRPGEGTVRDEGVRAALRRAKALGLRTGVKPHVDLVNDADRAGITADERWFAAYRRMILHYATLAAEERADLFVVGTELAGTSGQAGTWRELVAEVRQRFPGPVTYAANFDEVMSVTWWDALDMVGVDAYWPLSDRPTDDPGALRRAWRPIVDAVGALAARVQRPVLLTEAGYASQRGTVTAPWDWELSRVPDDAEQAAAYEALFSAWSERPWFQGVVLWMWDDLPGRSPDDQRLDYTPHNKPAEAVLRSWARRLTRGG